MVTTTTKKLGASITVAFVYPILVFVHYKPEAKGAVNTARGHLRPGDVLPCSRRVVLVLIGAAMFFGYRLGLQAPRRKSATPWLQLEASRSAAAPALL